MYLGYDAWMEGYGNALHGMYVYDQRLIAAEFLKRIGAEWEGETAADDKLKSLANQEKGVERLEDMLKLCTPLAEEESNML